LHLLTNRQQTARTGLDVHLLALGEASGPSANGTGGDPTPGMHGGKLILMTSSVRASVRRFRRTGRLPARGAQNPLPAMCSRSEAVCGMRERRSPVAATLDAFKSRSRRQADLHLANARRVSWFFHAVKSTSFIAIPSPYGFPGGPDVRGHRDCAPPSRSHQAALVFLLPLSTVVRRKE